MSMLLSLVLAQTSGLPGLYRIDLLPTYRKSVSAGAVTSYDRNEGNDDGFSGKYSFVRREGDTLVLADLKGPGCITRIHTPTPTDDPLEFYFDGEAAPRVAMPFRKLFTGGTAPFLRPLVDAVGGGYYSYVPMPYAKSCKVVLRARSLQFYDLNYATYPAGTKIQTFDPKVVDPGLGRAKTVFSSGPAPLSGTTSPLARFEGSLRPGKSLTLFETRKGGRIDSFELGPAAAFAGKDRDLLLRIAWDGSSKPAVLMPVGDFFGYAWGKPSMASALVGSGDGMDYCKLPMPFEKGAKVELVSLRTTGSPIPIHANFRVSQATRRKDEGEFYAVWRRELPTTQGKPFTWLEAKGRGHVVGLSLQAQGIEAGNTFFFEGDDKTTIDGQLAVHGTGSEDFFNGGWYDVPGRWDGSFSRALSGCLAYQRYLGRTGGFRFLLNDAYAYRQSIVQTIEHGPERNAHPSDYVGVTYLYSDRSPGAPMIGERRVVDPKRLVYSAHWTMPIEGFSLSHSTLTRGNVKVGDRSVRALSLRAKEEGDFDLAFITLRADIPAAGRYKVYLDAVRGPESGKIGLFQEDAPLGPTIDLYAPKLTEANGLYVGTIDAREGGNALMFKIVGKHLASGGLGMDLVNVVCERI